MPFYADSEQMLWARVKHQATWISRKPYPQFQFASPFVTSHRWLAMNDRELVLNAVQEMPEDASIKQIVDELLLLDDVKTRLAMSERGEPGVPHAEVVKMLDSWTSK